jgi:soluble lytic murein transglycosylase-like protein
MPRFHMLLLLLIGAMACSAALRAPTSTVTSRTAARAFSLPAPACRPRFQALQARQLGSSGSQPPQRRRELLQQIRLVHSLALQQPRHGASQRRVEPALIHAVISVESAYNPSARSHAGAVGLMQLMPETAKRYGVTNRLDPAQNIQGGARYLRDLTAMFNGNLQLVLAAYNAGEEAVIKYGKKIPPYRETQAYVKRVASLYQQLCH